MGRITQDMLRQRAEHNEGLLSSLEEIALHQQNIERIELLGQLCRHLKILYLQNNLIGKLENLHRLKELQYLNIAVNNIRKVQNLQRCESLAKLDLTMNFVDKAGLLSLASLRSNPQLRELYLLGNPCADWEGYRPFVIATLPALQRLDGQEIKPSERIAACQRFSELQARLRAELLADGVDPVHAAAAQDDGEEDGDMPDETGYVGPDGEMRRPWSVATRLLDHREMEASQRSADEQRRTQQQRAASQTPQLSRHIGFPELKDGEQILQRNEGKWEFSLEESADGLAILLDVAIGKYLDSSLVKADVQPRHVRLLIKGRLLQLALPQEVKPDSSTAQRSAVSGHLLVSMPKENPASRPVDVTCLRPRCQGQTGPSSTAIDATAPQSSTTHPTKLGKHTHCQPLHTHNGRAARAPLALQPRAKARALALQEDDDDHVPGLHV